MEVLSTRNRPGAKNHARHKLRRPPRRSPRRPFPKRRSAKTQKKDLGQRIRVPTNLKPTCQTRSRPSLKCRDKNQKGAQNLAARIRQSRRKKFQSRNCKHTSCSYLSRSSPVSLLTSFPSPPPASPPSPPPPRSSRSAPRASSSSPPPPFAPPKRAPRRSRRTRRSARAPSTSRLWIPPPWFSQPQSRSRRPRALCPPCPSSPLS
mmetsp:Transcript_7698/g.25651  ORF Transcript_7698/g.25651 Transcript_7698/m.25651 type:complete len:205 (+) Transcript_7698:3748-4362(+)